MSDHIVKSCPECGQRLRIPKRIGGMLMSCPSCGAKFGSDFKIGNSRKGASRGVTTTLFELPSTLFDRIIRYFSSR